MKITFATGDNIIMDEKDDRIYFHVYNSRKSNTACGYITASWRTGEETFEFIKSSYGVPVMDAWEDAKRLAEEKGIEEIIIFDPEGEFEKVV